MCPSTLPGKFPGQWLQGGRSAGRTDVHRGRGGSRGCWYSLHVVGSAAAAERRSAEAECAPPASHSCGRGLGTQALKWLFCQVTRAAATKEQCGNPASQGSSPHEHKQRNSPTVTTTPLTGAQLPHATAPRGALTGTAQAPATAVDPLKAASSSSSSSFSPLASLAFAHLWTSSSEICTTWPIPFVHVP